MSEEKDKDKKPTTDTTGQTAEKPVETPTTTAKIEVVHKFESKPADVPPAEKPKEEKPAEKPVEKPAETPKVETPKPDEKKDGNGETIEDLKAQLEERDAQLGLIATKAFEDEKKALLDTIKDEAKRKYVEDYIKDDPERMAQIKAWTNIMVTGIEQAGGDVKGKIETKPVEGAKPVETPKNPPKPEDDGTEDVPPSGAKIPPITSKTGDVKQIAKETIDTLFTILGDPSKSQAEKDVANQKINEMYAEFRRGAKESGKRDSYPLIPTMNCPKCGKIMQGNTCQTCGYEIPKIQRDSVFGK